MNSDPAPELLRQLAQLYGLEYGTLTSLGDLQGLLGHRQIETTRKFYAPILLALLRKTVSKRKLKLA